MALDSMQEILERMEAENKPFWQVVQDTDREERQVTAEASEEKMRATWQAMLESVTAYQGERMSLSGLVGGDGERMRRYAREKQPLSGAYLQEVIATALCVGESNACMRKIVAAPTAGACGVLPAVLVPLYQSGQAGEEEILRALYVAAGIGAVVGYRACIAGAAGGCQAEIGTASAMAAGALTALRGGSGEQVGHAVAMALKNLMGLICDPVAGLVEVPCVKRNVVGAVNAVSCADMALAGITSRVPVDQVIDCMGDVGRRLPVEFRETALGGLAATPFGQSVKEQMQSRRESQET
ncbi:L-serine ammonia-lyase, iron-sulfur-dependent, subunit alpha [Dysosmobacter sp.]|uniref:L-serine ammonia-lyase, iron-sulfur-dependent, subunit alpha n=1 Tax=Dysosmobacter sp. TaxID=2591382 RepID=UPI003D8E5685